MSERTFPNAILNEESLLTSSGKEHVDELQTKKDDEEESNELLADDALDDSSSSYCTALCSLSEYSEALEDEAQLLGNEAQCESASSESTDSIIHAGESAKDSSCEDNLQEVRSMEDQNLQDALSKDTLCEHDDVSASVTESLFLESHHLSSFDKKTISNSNTININSTEEHPEGTDALNLATKDALLKPWNDSRNDKNLISNEAKSGENAGSSQLRFPLDINKLISSCEELGESKYSSSPENEVEKLNILNMDTVEAESDKAPSLTMSSRYSSLKSPDYFTGNKNIDSKPSEKFNCSEPRSTSISIWTIKIRNQNDRESGQENRGKERKEDPTTHQQIFREDNRHSMECKPDRGGSNIAHVKWEREEQGKGVEEQQAELSLKAKNRKVSASCTSTLTASKQKSGIPPRCYSERILATGHQHHPWSPPLSRRLQKQSGQGVWLPSSLPPIPCSSYRQSCNTADNSRRKSAMATKLAETTTEVRPLCPEKNYLDTFDSSHWSSPEIFPDGSFQECSGDVLSFKLPMASASNHNNSACSEASSFECIDVALESHEAVNRNAKTVPKRQIQLKRRDMAESHINEINSNAIPKAPSVPSRPRDVLQRQHSTPGAFHQNSQGWDPKPLQAERKQRLQKSLSLDETSSRTKMASCIIKSILTKRMIHEQNLRDLDVSDNTFAPITAGSASNNNNSLPSSALDGSSKNTKVNLTTAPPLSCGSSSETPALKTERQTNTTSVKELISDSSKHKFNPTFGNPAAAEFQGSGTEITVSPETEKDKLSPSKELASRSPREKLSCDSAKGKAWNSSAVISRAISKQAAAVQPTLAECFAAQVSHKQHNVKKQPIASDMEKKEKPGEGMDNTQSPTMTVCLAYDLDADAADNVLSPGRPGKDQEGDRGELRPPGPSVNIGIQSQGKFKSIAPVHVVRDMRSLVKNTYSLSFRGPGEAAQGLEDTAFGFPPATRYQVSSSKGEDKSKGYKCDEKPQVRKVTPPLAVDRIRDLASLHATPKGCTTKTASFLEPHDKSPNAGFTKVSPISTGKANSCAVSKSPKVQEDQTAIRQVDVQVSNTNTKQTTQLGVQQWAGKELSSEIVKNEQSTDSSKAGFEQFKDSAQHYCPPMPISDQQGSYKESEQVCIGTIDGNHTPGLPPRSQTSTGPSSTCILTVTPTPILPSYFYQPNPLGYQTVPGHMGTMSYVQGPVLLQTPSHSQPATVNGPATVMRSLSADAQLLSQPLSTAGHTTKQASSKKTEKRETQMKTPSPDTQQCGTFVANLGTDVFQGNVGMLYPEVGGSLTQSPRHMLLDPETGRCFYVEMPQLPQRKMLFDPQTCQYVEVLLPQQTLPSTVLPTHCAVPFPSVHIPAMYTPQCLSYIQAQPHVLPPPGP